MFSFGCIKFADFAVVARTPAGTASPAQLIKSAE